MKLFLAEADISVTEFTGKIPHPCVTGKKKRKGDIPV